MTDPCRCTSQEQAGVCRRAGVEMVRPLWQLCQQREDYRRLWDGLPQTEAAPQPPAVPLAVGIDRLKTCAKRGKALKENGKTVLREY